METPQHHKTLITIPQTMKRSSTVVAALFVIYLHFSNRFFLSYTKVIDSKDSPSGCYIDITRNGSEIIQRVAIWNENKNNIPFSKEDVRVCTYLSGMAALPFLVVGGWGLLQTRGLEKLKFFKMAGHNEVKMVFFR